MKNHRKNKEIRYTYKREVQKPNVVLVSGNETLAFRMCTFKDVASTLL